MLKYNFSFFDLYYDFYFWSKLNKMVMFNGKAKITKSIFLNNIFLLKKNKKYGFLSFLKILKMIKTPFMFKKKYIAGIPFVFPVPLMYSKQWFLAFRKFRNLKKVRRYTSFSKKVYSEFLNIYNLLVLKKKKKYFKKYLILNKSKQSGTSFSKKRNLFQKTKLSAWKHYQMLNCGQSNLFIKTLTHQKFKENLSVSYNLQLKYKKEKKYFKNQQHKLKKLSPYLVSKGFILRNLGSQYRGFLDGRAYFTYRW